MGPKVFSWAPVQGILSQQGGYVDGVTPEVVPSTGSCPGR